MVGKHLVGIDCSACVLPEWMVLDCVKRKREVSEKS